ncbi:hypothetical protein GMLC_04160 [Geomonas limicola]|uniref:J domain-containing protein n=1 Tax=Geomonas limicola TaxID=2740186 RepID=A0A6V8N4R7_9BACT|nr:hypothetical protein [Geomonas limicola]GFO66837.1 hypothetical protein GMLC_04160 [Geomonas limicola]
MGTEQENELTDVVLCYQALGLPMDASPAQIEKLYKALSEEHRKQLSVGSPANREEARQSLEQVNAMYEKIRGSVTYHAAEREQQKRQDAGQPLREAPIKMQRTAELKKTFRCPRCNGEVPHGRKVCPICKSRLYTPVERLFLAVFSKRMLVLYAVVTVLVAGAIFFLNSRTPAQSTNDSGLEGLQAK